MEACACAADQGPVARGLGGRRNTHGWLRGGSWRGRGDGSRELRCSGEKTAIGGVLYMQAPRACVTSVTHIETLCC